jgi:microcystin-dependent protein
MRNTFKKSTLSLALATGLIGSAAWSTDSHACAAEPLVSSVCIMGMVNWGDFGGGMFALADGRLLSISQNAALYSLIGQTYGGSGQVSFGIPDLRGRVVMGSGRGPGLPQFNPGQAFGALTTNLTTAQLPTHAHTLTGVSVNTSKMTATTTLSGLTTTTNLGGLSISGTATGLKLNASTTTGTLADPTGNALGAAPGGQGKIYTTGTPSVAMNASSIGGNLSLSIASGTTAPGTVSGGSATTTLGGTATLSGATDPNGASQEVSLMQPSLVLNYYIAVQGIYPTRN